MSITERLFDKLGDRLVAQAEMSRAQLAAGLTETTNGLRVTGARNRPLPARGSQLMWGGSGRLGGWSIRAQTDLTLTLHDGRDPSDDTLAVLELTAGQTDTRWFGAGGITFGEALYLHSTPAAKLQRSNLSPVTTFDNGAGGLTAYANGTTGTASRTVETVTPFRQPGLKHTKARRLTSDGLGGSTADRIGDMFDVPAAPGDQHTMSLFMRQVSGSTAKQLVVYVEWRVEDGAGGTVAVPAGGVGTTVPNTDVRRANFTTSVAPEGTKAAQVFVWLQGAGGSDAAAAVSAEWAGMLIEPTTTLGSYFDGNTTDRATVDHSWTGTPGLSASEARDPAAGDTLRGSLWLGAVD